MTSKFPEMIQFVQEIIPQYGTKVTVQHPINTVAGQQSPAVYDTYEIDVLFKVNYATRQTDYIRMDYLRILMPASDNPQPLAGDVLTTPDGRKFIVETVSTVKPDGFPVVFDLSVRDG